MPLKVLIIEANTTRQRQLKSLLTVLGNKAADLDVVEDPRAVMSLLVKKRFDCCFLALELPGKSYVHILEEIRARGSTKSLPVIVFGAGATKEAVLATINGGASGFLAVPLALEGVEQVLRKVFG